VASFGSAQNETLTERRRLASLPVRLALLVSAWAALYGATTLVLATRRHLWFDELVTYYVVRQPSVGDVLDVLRSGAEPLPPLFYLVTRGSTELFGDGPVGMRLPGLLGFLLACVCVFAFVARRSTPLHGVIAMFVPLVTATYGFAVEARPYGLYLGFAAAALLCWQLRADGTGGLAAAVGLGCFLALATASHYYAVFVLVPILLGEAVRSRARRQLDLSVLVALAAAFVPLLLAAPFLRAAHGLSATFWAKPHLDSAIDWFGWLLRSPAIPRDRLSVGEATAFVVVSLLVALYLLLATLPARAASAFRGARADIVLIIAGAALAVAAALSERHLTWVAGVGLVGAALGVVRLARRRGTRHPRPPAHEVVAAASFALLPLLCVVSAAVFTGAYVHRYALAAVIAPAILLPLALHRLDTPRALLSRVVAVATIAFFVLVFADTYKEITVDRRDERDSIGLLRRVEQERGLPVAVSHPHASLGFARYAPPDVTARMIALVSPEAADRFVGSNSTEIVQLALDGITPLRMERFEDYLASNRPFVLLFTAYLRDWLRPALEANGRRLRVLGAENGWTVYLVEPRRTS
jgi:hypothetical protein